MEKTKQEIHEKLRILHDEIKRHPFRSTFETKYIGNYKDLLYDLSVAWCDLIWHCNEHSEEEQRLYRQFGGWIHDYRQYLRTYDRRTFPMRIFPYYEQILQITHMYLDSGKMDYYYNLDSIWIDEPCRSEKYELITKEKCGIDSPILPLFYPVETPLCADESKVLAYINESWRMQKLTPEEKIAVFEKWKREEQPIIEWINSNMRNPHDGIRPIWYSCHL